MAETYHTVAASDLRRFNRAAKEFERNQGGRSRPGQRPPHIQQHSRPDILVILLDAVNSGQRVQAAILEEITTNETQFVTAFGTPTGGYFRLGFKPSPTAASEWTAHIDPLLDDASKITGYFEALPSISPGDVIINFGLVTTPDLTTHVPNRWSVTFSGRYAGVDVELLEVDDHVNNAELEVDSSSILEDSGRVEWVREGIGVGVPTPIRAGARALCHWVSTIGYVIGSVEARDYGDYGLMSDSPQ